MSDQRRSAVSMEISGVALNPCSNPKEGYRLWPLFDEAMETYGYDYAVGPIDTRIIATVMVNRVIATPPTASHDAVMKGAVLEELQKRGLVAGELEPEVVFFRRTSDDIATVALMLAERKLGESGPV